MSSKRYDTGANIDLAASKVQATADQAQGQIKETATQVSRSVAEAAQKAKQDVVETLDSKGRSQEESRVRERAEDSIEKARHYVQENTEHAKDQLRHIAEHVGHTISETVHKVEGGIASVFKGHGESGSHVGEKVDANVDRASQSVQETAGNIKENVVDTARQAGSSVADAAKKTKEGITSTVRKDGSEFQGRSAGHEFEQWREPGSMTDVRDRAHESLGGSTHAGGAEHESAFQKVTHTVSDSLHRVGEMLLGKGHDEVPRAAEKRDLFEKVSDNALFKSHLRYNNIGQHIKDPIHDSIKVFDLAKKFVDTQEFQRLRYLKQLGALELVFPGGSHNRFEHSMGVYHLSLKYIKSIKENQPALEITDEDIESISIAGLCHDLGHGPYSHLFDNTFMKAVRPGLKWTHEDASVAMVEELVEENGIEISTDQVKYIQDLIKGDDRKGFKYEIVANKRTSIDVDKFDYLLRDSYHTGIKYNFDYMRLLNYSKVINGNICYAYKVNSEVRSLFTHRFEMHERVYQHRAAKACEYMIVDAFIAADEKLGISSRVDDMSQYKFLNDTILNQIESSIDPDLKVSREIIRRIRTRKLYRCLNHFIIPPILALKIDENQLTAHEFLKHVNHNELIRKEDFQLDLVNINFTRRDKSPFAVAAFYNHKAADPVPEFLPEEQMSLTLPRNYQQMTLRIFSKRTSDDRDNVIYEVYLRFLKHLLLTIDPANPHEIASDRCHAIPSSQRDVERLDSMQMSQMLTPKRNSAGATSMSTPVTPVVGPLDMTRRTTFPRIDSSPEAGIPLRTLPQNVGTYGIETGTAKRRRTLDDENI